MRGKPFIYLCWLTLAMALYVGVALPKMVSASNTVLNLGALITIPICITVWVNAVWAVIKDLITKVRIARGGK